MPDQKLLDLINSVPAEIKELIEQRLTEFRLFKLKSDQEWFSELCFCLLTANSRAKTAIEIQNKLGFHGFAFIPEERLAILIKEHKHRFHNNKAKYIVNARKFLAIKKQIQAIVDNNGTEKAREWLVNNVKGLGYKEASHFLRNTGHEDVSILDRHILRLLKEHDFIEQVPKSLNAKRYIQIESVFNKIAFLTDMTPAKLDLYMWYLKTNEVLK